MLAKEMAKKLYRKPDDEERLRCAVGRAYYSAHHAVRSMVLHDHCYDPDGHEETIEMFAKMLKNRGFQRRSRPTRRTADKMSEAKANREVADYSPYDMSRLPNSESWILITGNSWRKAAQFNTRWAEKVFVGAKRVVGL